MEEKVVKVDVIYIHPVNRMVWGSLQMSAKGTLAGFQVDLIPPNLGPTTALVKYENRYVLIHILPPPQESWGEVMEPKKAADAVLQSSLEDKKGFLQQLGLEEAARSITYW